MNNDILTYNPQITYFKENNYNITPFYKQYSNIKEQQLNWEDMKVFDMNKQEHYLGNMYLKIKIPYFQLKKDIVSTTQTTTSNKILNNILYDNFECYLFLVNGKYYLVPLFLLNNKINYDFEIINFKDISQYFNNVTQYNIDLEQDIYFASFNNVIYINDVIPLLLTFGINVDRYYLNLLNTVPKDILYNPTLTPNTFDIYLERIIKQYLFDDYQNMNKLESSYLLYELISNEIKYFYKNYTFISNKTLDSLSNLDVNKSYLYYLTNGFTSDIIEYLKDTIKNNSLLVQYLINNMCPTKTITYTFYKKYSNIPNTSIYELIIESSASVQELLDPNSTGATNRITEYYPKLYLDIDAINDRLPFTLTTNMVFKTVGNFSATYSVSGTNHILTIDDKNGTYENDKILFYVELQQTNNDVYDNVVINDNNMNNEWTSNLSRYLEGDLQYNTNIELFIFNEFKKNFYLKELLINNLYNNFKLTAEQIKDLWIELKVYYDRFFKTGVEINYILGDDLNYSSDGTDFYTDKKAILTDYENIQNIENFPQDMFNTYLLCIREFVESIKYNYFDNNIFLYFWHNKLVTYFFKRFFKISTLDDSVNDNFNGLIFYTNFNSNFYISKEIIRNSIKEMFHKSTFIGYLKGINDSDIRKVKTYTGSNDSNGFPIVDEYSIPHRLKIQKVRQFYGNDDFTNNDYTDCFQDYRSITNYTITKEDCIFDGNYIYINKNLFNYYYFHDNLTMFTINVNNTIYTVVSYKISDKYLELKLNVTLNNIDFILIEDSHYAVPYIYTDRTNVIYDEYIEQGVGNNFKRYTIYDKDGNINKIIDNTNIYFNDVEVDGNPFLNINTQKYHFYINLVSESKTITEKVYLVDNNFYKTVMVDETNTYFIDYERYDYIYLDVLVLPMTIMELDNTDMETGYDLLNTYPYVYLSKTSPNYNSIIADNLATIKTINGYNVKLEDVETDYVKLLVMDNNDFTGSTITFVVYNNDYLPNLLYHSSLWYVSGEQNKKIITDFYLQKPIMLKIVEDGESYPGNSLNNNKIPSYVFVNLPNNTNLDRYISHTAYLNDKEIDIVSNINSGQIFRYDKTDPEISTGIETLYNLNYDSSILSDVKYLDTIETDILNMFDSSFNGYKGNIIDLIENSYSEYFKLYTNIFNILETTDDFGSSSNSIYKNILDLNKFTSETNQFEYTLDIQNYKLFEYDCYTPYSISIYNFTNGNGQVLENDFNLISMLNKKYEDADYLIATPFLEFETRLKVSNGVYTYLQNVNKLSKQQLDYNEENKMVDTIVNTNISTEATNIVEFTQNKYVDKYVKYTNTVNKSKITVKNNNGFTEYINNDNTDDIYIVGNYNDTDIDLTLDSGYIYTTNDIELYNDSLLYNHNRVDNHDIVYKLIGAIRVVDNHLVLNETLPTKIDYIKINDIVYDYSNLSISNYNCGFYYSDCYSYVINSIYTNVTLNDINSNKDNVYIYKIKSSDFNVLTVGEKYYIEINDVYCYGEYDGTILTLLCIEQLYFYKTITFIYRSISDNDTLIFNNIRTDNNNLIVNNTIIVDNFTLVGKYTFNKYTTDIITEGIIFDSVNKTNLINTNLTYNLLGFYFINCNYSNIYIYDIEKTTLPPIYVNNSSIKLYSTLDEVNWLENSNHWLCIGDTETQVKNINNITISDGTYLLYYSEDDIKPSKIINTDIYYEKVYFDSTLNSSLPENKYKNIDDTEKIFQHYYRQQFFTRTNLDDYQLDEYLMIVLNKGLNSDIRYLINGFNRNGSVNEETGETYSQNRLYSEKVSYGYTDIIIQNNSGDLYKRPLVIKSDTLDKNHKYLYYQYYLTGTSDRVDSLYVFDSSSVVGNFMDVLFDLTKHIGFTSLTDSFMGNINGTISNVSISSKNSLIEVTKTSDSLHTLSIITLDYFTEDIFYKILLDVEFTYNSNTYVDEMIIWLMKSDTYPKYSLRESDGSGAPSTWTYEYVTEPLYMRTDRSDNFRIDLESVYTFNYIDNMFFYINNGDNIANYRNANLSSTNTNFTLISKKLKSFEEVKNNPNVDEIGVYNNTGTYLHHIKNTWEYIDTFDINNVGENSIITSSVLVNYIKNNKLPLLFINNDTIYYRNISQYSGNNIVLDDKVTFNNADVYIYPFEPFFINEELTINVDIDTAYIYSENKLLSRNEIIIVGNIALLIDYYSTYYDCYICKVINNNTNITSNGYYSLGKYNNYFERNRILINNSITDNIMPMIFDINELTPGDLYILNNELNIFDGDYSLAPINNIFKFNGGNYIEVLYIDGNFYYDFHTN